MKFREGFVTNSSSSSFIIAYKDVNKMFKGKKGVSYVRTLLDFFEQTLVGEENDGWFNTTPGVIVGNEEELRTYFMDRYVWSDTTLEEYLEKSLYMKEKFEKCLNYLNGGFKLVFREIADADEVVYNLFENVVDNENIILVEKDRD